MPNPMIAMIGGSLGSAAIGAVGASKAAKAQTASADRAAELQREMFEKIETNLTPYREAGGSGLSAYLYEMGMGDQPEGYTGYQTSPMASYLMNRGVESIDASAASRGGLYSGATLEALEGNRREIITADTDAYMTRLRDMVGIGQSASAQEGQAGQAYATNAGNAFMQAGNARANGYLGMANAIQGGIGDAAGIYGYFSNPMQAYAAPTAAPAATQWPSLW